MLPPSKIQELQETYGLISSLWSHSGKFWLPPSDWGAGVVLDVLCQLPASQYTVLVPHADIKLKILMPGFHIPSDPCWDLGNVRASFLVFTKSLEVDCPQPEKWPALGPCLLSFFSLSPVFQTTSHVSLSHVTMERPLERLGQRVQSHCDVTWLEAFPVPLERGLVLL